MAAAEFHIHTFYADFERGCIQIGMSVPQWFASGKSLAFLRSTAGQRQLAIALLQDAERQGSATRPEPPMYDEIAAKEMPDGSFAVRWRDGRMENMPADKFREQFRPYDDDECAAANRRD